MKEFYFEKLEVWQESRSFVKEIYLITKSFPNEENFGITSQIKRASSVFVQTLQKGCLDKQKKTKQDLLIRLSVLR
jgi:four helix bundle protein